MSVAYTSDFLITCSLLDCSYKPLSMPHQFIHDTFILQLHYSNSHLISELYCMHNPLSNCSFYPSSKGDHLLPDIGKQDSHPLTVTWSASYPKCYSFTVYVPLHSRWFISDTSHTLTSLHTHTHTQTHARIHTRTYTYICHTLASFPGRLGLISAGAERTSSLPLR